MRREALLAIALLPAALPAEEPAAATGPLRVREIYVPSSELEARIAREPRGVVMTLDEYRALVLRGLPRQGAEPPELPPLDASVVAAWYEGKLSERAVRLRATLEVRSTRDGWALLDLGRPLDGLGSVLVDGRPGFIIIDTSPRPGKDGEAKLVEEPRARLLVEGAGAHTVTLEASLPVSVNDDRWSLEGRLVPAAASRIEVEVPGNVAASSEPPFLDISRANGASRLVLAAGRAEAFRLEWRRAEERGESGALVAAEHRVAFLLDPRSPTFTWEADVLVARGKVAFLDLREPRSARVLAVEGHGVVSWARVEGAIRVFLAEPSEGRVPLGLSGVLEPAARFELGPPGAAGSFASWGSMAMRADPSVRVRIESTANVDEIATADPLVERVYAFRSDAARVTAALEGVPARFESRAAYLLSVGEAASVLEGAFRIAPAEGRVHRFPLALPEGWRLVSLVEAPREGAAPRGIRHEEAARLVEVHLGRAASRGDPADVRFRLEREGTGGEPGAGEIDLALPAAPGADRSRTDVAVSLPPSLDARMPELPGWRSLPLEELELLGLAPAAERPLAAGLSTDAPAPRLRFSLVERPARGEYRLAVFLLALERQVRVRADMRVAAVDRPIREVAVVLPPGAIGGAVIAGDGIGDSRADAALSARIARWSKPWLGTRQIRVEYEVPHQEGAAVPLPSVDVRIPGGGRLGGERFLLIQSRGPVEVETSPGPGLAPAAVEDIPDLAEPWSEGRILTAFRYRSAGDPGTFRTKVHDRAPVLASIAREVKLTTVIGRDGTSRTRAEVLVARSSAQRLVIILPEGATPIAVAVDGDTLRAVGPPGPADGAPAETGPRSISIPLPARSHSAVTLVYERLAGGARALGSAGTWIEEGPRFAGMPVGSTRWDIHHPAGYRFEPSGGNMVAAGDRSGREGFFAETFIAPLLSGNRPRFTALETSARAGAPAPLPPLTPEEALGAEPQGRIRRAEGGLIEPAGDRQPGKQPGAPGDAAPVYRLVPEGPSVDVSKLGGDARIVLAYEQAETGRSARLAVFSGVLVLGALLGIRLGARRLAGIALAGLSIGILLPLALSVASPLLVVPACEALLVLAAAAGLTWACRQLAARRRAAKAIAAGLLVLLPIGALRSDEIAVPQPEGALIPYDPVKGIADPLGPGNEVYVPEKVFSDLWRRAYPDALPPEPPPAEIVPGSGEYRLRVDEGGGSWRMTGSLPVRVLTDEWVSLPLPFTRSRLVSIRVDGEPASAAEIPSGVGGPARTLLPLRGRGSRRVEIEVAGTLDREHGARIALIEVAAGAGASVRAELPRGARIEARVPPGMSLPVTVEAGERGLIAVLDLGLARIAELRWSFPGVEGDTGTQLESLSYTELALRFEGIAVDRRERLRATGRAVDSARYAAPAGWRITDVSGPEVARWSVAAAEAGGERLEVFFARPVAFAEIRVKGLAPLDVSGLLPVLVLEDAARAETYIGIRHGGGRRFEADILAGMRRASRDDVARVFGLAAEEAPDRAYHAFGSGAGETLTIDPRGGDVVCDTRLVLVIEESRLVLAARSRLAVTGEGPLRFELFLPDGWEVRGVRCAGMRGWDAAPAPGGRRLSVRFEGRARSGTEVLWSAERAWNVPAPVDPPALAAAFPGAGTSREDRLWTVAASDALDVASLESPGLVPAPLEPLESWALLPPGADARFALRSARGEAAPGEGPRLSVSRRESALRATIVCVARLAEDALHVNARLVLRPTRGSVERFRFRLPRGAELDGIETANQRSRDLRPGPGGLEVEIALHSPSSGEHPVDVSYLVRRAGELPPIEPITVLSGDRPLENVDQYAAVLQGSTAVISAAAARGLAPIEARELPWLPSGVLPESLRPAFRATALDWSISLAEEEIEVARGPDAVVRLAELSTAIGGDGVARTQASYSIENRSLQFLIVEMPEGSSLWGVSLGGKPIAVGEDGSTGGRRRLRVPLEHVGAANLELEVSIRYEERPLSLPSIRGNASLSAPRILGPQIVQTIWNVDFPREYSVSAAGGNMREVAGSARSAKKIENLLEQLEKVSKASAADSARVRGKAERELRRLEQALGDSAAELEERSRGAAEEARAGEIGRDALERQWADNKALMEKTRKAQLDLREARQVREGQAAEPRAQGPRPQAPQEQPGPEQQAAQQQQQRSKAEQAFEDTTNYMKRSWSKNTAPAQQAAETPAGRADAGAADLRALLEGQPFRGLAGAAAGPLAPAADAATAKPLDGLRVLKPLDDRIAGAAAPGLEAPPTPAGGAAYTFVHAGGDAELTLGWTRKDLAPRAVASALLAAGAAAAIWLGKRRRA